MCAMNPANETTSASSLSDCSVKCGRDATCIGFNIKNSLTCDITVLASTSRTQLPASCTSTSRDSSHFSRAACSTRFHTFSNCQRHRRRLLEMIFPSLPLSLPLPTVPHALSSLHSPFHSPSPLQLLLPVPPPVCFLISPSLFLVHTP